LFFYQEINLKIKRHGGKIMDNRFGGNDRGPQRSFGGPRRSFGGPRRQFDGERTMHKTTCSECKQECEVPFKPTEGKPVYCKECFAKHRKF
jgi:CxxC-x17-CxxC domain-containing protein